LNIIIAKWTENSRIPEPETGFECFRKDGSWKELQWKSSRTGAMVVKSEEQQRSGAHAGMMHDERLH
jgi:hypothetical protein